MKTVKKQSPLFCLYLVCILALITPTHPLSAQIIINEIHYDPDESASPVEFIELFNPGPDAVDISGWHFGNGISYVFPEGILLHADDYLMVVQDPDAFIEKYTASRRSRVRKEAVYGPFEGRLNNDGETVEFCQADGSVVDRVRYGMGFPWPVVGDPVPPSLPGYGPSIQLVNPLLDNALPANWRAAVPTPDQYNSAVYTDNEPTHFQSKAQHLPQQPTSGQDVTITVACHDPDGIQQVLLACQIVRPGNYIPLRFPRSIVAMNDNPDVVSNINPQYEADYNWQYTVMVDDGTHGDATPDDQIYTAVFPAQNHRTLVRYRITATDLQDASVTIPYPEDASTNYAYFVYDGVPEYQGFSSEVMESLPVYHLITREYDLHQALGWNGQNRISQGAPAWFVYNWYGTIVYDGVVYDNIRYRLRGGNGRYFPYSNAKRRMRFRFNRDHFFQARDAQGNPYPTKWRTLTTHNGAELRGTLTYGFNEYIDFLLYNQIGVPAPFSYYFHLRVIDDEQESPDPWRGDFWGAIFAQETYDSRFLEAHDLPPGNLYKLINSTNDAKRQQRYQAPDAVTNGADFRMAVSLSGSKTASYIEDHVSLPEWNRYHALCQAVRHYDWPSGQRNKNAAWYFEPYYAAENDYLGLMWTLPYDLDASWGPNWNNGEDIVYVAVFAMRPDRDPLLVEYYNEIREIRDLLWQKDQIEPLLDHHAAKILPFMEADRLRWFNAPSDAGSYNGLGGAGVRGLDALVSDMKDFAFVGGSWPGGSVGTGGRAAFLDRLADRTEGNFIPNQPSISYVGTPGYPGNDLRFETSAFDDPQGKAGFAALKWRVGEVDPNIPLKPAPAPQGTALIPPQSTWQYFKGTSEPSARGQIWRRVGFNDASWPSAQTPLGYGEPLVGTELPDMHGNYSTLYLRKKFTVAHVDQVGRLVLSVLYDDAFIVWINGSLVAQDNVFTDEMPYNATATSSREVRDFIDFQVDEPDALLLPGDNVVCVQVLNSSRNSSDCFIDLALTMAEAGGGAELPAPARGVPVDTFKLEVASLWEQERTDFDPRVTIPGSVIETGHVYRVRCKMKDNTGRWSHWSDPVQFVAGDALDTGLRAHLRMTELMYHPADAPDSSALDDNAFEFVELQNTGPESLDLTGLSLSGGINFSFQDADITGLAPGAFVLVVRNRAAFELRYGTALMDQVAGEYTGRLSNGGETITVTDYLEGVLIEFSYDDSWYPSTDGAGLSLVAVNPDQDPASDLNSKKAWRPSLDVHGSPGSQ